ncbi:MAG: hypothetical protein MUF49_04250 [Oculatellaceae cyanobacterium Prado106]|nr:hypothetical protein [Oculatellaceae cyanobacterium Prado106]
MWAIASTLQSAGCCLRVGRSLSHHAQILQFTRSAMQPRSPVKIKTSPPFWVTIMTQVKSRFAILEAHWVYSDRPKARFE